MAGLEYEKKEDKELVAEYLAGNEAVLPFLINRYIKIIYRFVFGLVLDESTAEDITQDVFIKVWKKFSSYNDKYPFKTWLFSIARNTTIDYFRKKKDIVFSKFDNEEGDNFITDTLADDSPTAVDIFARLEDISIFNKAMAEIAPLYREVLILRYTNDLSIEEIAQILKRPVETVKSQHRRGILHLKEILIRNNLVKNE